MTHRYLAGTLGMLLLVVAVTAWRSGSQYQIATTLPLLVAFQALLGMWTVTLGLEPVIVVAHLIGGLTILAVLWWLLLEDRAARAAPSIRADAVGERNGGQGVGFYWIWTLLSLGLLVVQIVLGGWTSSSHAALACAGFPTCNGAWWPDADFATAIRLGVGAEPVSSASTGAALIAIHWMHRVGALLVFAVLGGLALAVRGTWPRLRRLGALVGSLLLLQVGLGIANVLVGRPLPLAIAHNATAALLLLAVLTLLHQLPRASLISGESP